LYTSLTNRGIDATICVVCGRNEKLKNDLASRDWSSTTNEKLRKRIRRRFLRIPRLFRKRNSRSFEDVDPTRLDGGKGCVTVVGLGFITNMADYMVASDVLVTKAGPGTIAEAAAVGLPVMVTSFLPGQEAGNVDYVLENGFGDYNQDPVQIGETVATWLQDPGLLEGMSHRSFEIGQPQAAEEIVLDIGSITQAWKILNGDVAKPVRAS
jgi:1,2-diacylglycerol 3-beta-galactosyltransferase